MYSYFETNCGLKLQEMLFLGPGTFMAWWTFDRFNFVVCIFFRGGLLLLFFALHGLIIVSYSFD